MRITLRRPDDGGYYGTVTGSVSFTPQSSLYRLPFIFNYYTHDFDVSHATAQHDHGTHVAGITAANKIEGSSVIGVAPDAQIIVMQVFSAGGGAGWDTIMAGLKIASVWMSMPATSPLVQPAALRPAT